MSEQEREPAPHGSDEADTAELGEPEHEPAEFEEGVLEGRSEERPDLDERERNISPQRKPMGPPLEEAEGAEGENAPAAAEEGAQEPSDEPPTEPSEP